MKTPDLVSMLATGTTRSDPDILGKRLGLALLIGLIGASVLLVAAYGIRSDMPELLATPLFWIKVAFPLAILMSAQGVTARLARPGALLGMRRLILLTLPVLAIWLTSIGFLLLAPPSLRLALVLGSSWQVCSLNIALLSLPTFFSMFWAMCGLAPTRLMLTGASIGLVAGAQGVVVYTLYCTEMTMPFWGVWYVIGMLAPTAVGALLGPRLLRW